MSGSRDPIDLFGPAMLALVQAITELEELVSGSIVLVDGMAVLSRLRTAYRVTSDVDTVNYRLSGEPPRLDLLLDRGATPIDAAGAIISTSLGNVRVDVLEISTEQLDNLPSDPTDRLYVLAHDWALRTASRLRIRAVGANPQTREASVRVAEPGPLIATKLQALPNRSITKEATDLLDIIQLTVDEEAGTAARQQLSTAPAQLRADARLHVARWFDERAERSHRLVRATAAGQAVDLDTVILIGELLLACL